MAVQRVEGGQWSSAPRSGCKEVAEEYVLPSPNPVSFQNPLLFYLQYTDTRAQRSKLSKYLFCRCHSFTLVWGLRMSHRPVQPEHALHLSVSWKQQNHGLWLSFSPHQCEATWSSHWPEDRIFQTPYRASPLSSNESKSLVHKYNTPVKLHECHMVTVMQSVKAKPCVQSADKMLWSLLTLGLMQPMYRFVVFGTAGSSSNTANTIHKKVLGFHWVCKVKHVVYVCQNYLIFVSEVNPDQGTLLQSPLSFFCIAPLFPPVFWMADWIKTTLFSYNFVTLFKVTIEWK